MGPSAGAFHFVTAVPRPLGWHVQAIKQERERGRRRPGERKENESNKRGFGGENVKKKKGEMEGMREWEWERNPFWNAFHYDLGIENGN